VIITIAGRVVRRNIAESFRREDGFEEGWRGQINGGEKRVPAAAAAVAAS